MGKVGAKGEDRIRDKLQRGVGDMLCAQDLSAQAGTRSAFHLVPAAVGSLFPVHSVVNVDHCSMTTVDCATGEGRAELCST